MAQVEDLRKELAKRLAQCTNPQVLKEHIELCDRQRLQMSQACVAYKQLVDECAVADIRGPNIWAAISVANEDIILDTNDAFNGLYKYLIFNCYKMYQKYISTYKSYRDNAPAELKMLYTDQYRILSSNKLYSLMFDVVDATEDQLRLICDRIAVHPDLFTKVGIIIKHSSGNAYELILNTDRTGMHINLEKTMCFINSLENSSGYNELASKIRPKKIYYGTRSIGPKYIKLLQTQDAYNDKFNKIVWTMHV